MDKVALIKQQTEAIISQMVDSPTVEVTYEDEMFHISIQVGEQAPTVIGRHGETLRALQKILEVVAYKQTGERASLLINVNDYREKQVERLQYIADQAVQKVSERHAASYLRGFSSYERRVMHEYIAKQYPDMASYSVGEGRDRRLVIDTKENKPSEVQSENHQSSEQDEITIDLE